MEIGAAIRQTREGLGLKLETVAMEAGFDAGNLSRIETGKQQPSLKRLQNIAAAMKVRVADLFALVDAEPADVGVHALREPWPAYSEEMPVLKRAFGTLDARNRRTALEFIKMLNRLQRDEP